MEKLKQQILAMRVNKDKHRGAAPHKPILLLAVLEGFSQGNFRSRRIELTPELLGYFRLFWKQLVATPHVYTMGYPFFHLQTSPFWRLILKPDGYSMEELERRCKHLPSLAKGIEYAEMSEELAIACANPAQRKLLQALILDKFFPATKQNFHAPKGIEDPTVPFQQEIKNLPGKEYRKRIVREKVLQDGGEEEFVRSAAFQRVIPQIYDFTCAISGLHIKTQGDVRLIDACHIVPFSESQDDTVGNGISLTPTLHRAFDRGLISISNEYEVLIAPCLEESHSDWSILGFAGKRIRLPYQKEYWPLQGNLKQHRERWGM